jgi:hypothetical protein
MPDRRRPRRQGLAHRIAAPLRRIDSVLRTNPACLPAATISSHKRSWPRSASPHFGATPAAPPGRRASDRAVAPPVAASTPRGIAEELAVFRHDVRRGLAVLERLAPERHHRLRVDVATTASSTYPNVARPAKNARYDSSTSCPRRNVSSNSPSAASGVLACDHVRTDGVGLEFAQRPLLVEQPLREPFDAGRRPVRNDSSSIRSARPGPRANRISAASQSGSGMQSQSERDPRIAGAPVYPRSGLPTLRAYRRAGSARAGKLLHQRDAFVR